MIMKISQKQQDIMDMINLGMTIKEIAEHKGCCLQAVYKIRALLKKKELLINSKLKKQDVDYDRIVYLGRKYKLHRIIYSKYYGEIPLGNVIHHMDLNKKNNQIINLISLTPQEHLSLHKKLRVALPELTNTLLKEIRDEIRVA